MPFCKYLPLSFAESLAKNLLYLVCGAFTISANLVVKIDVKNDLIRLGDNVLM